MTRKLSEELDAIEVDPPCKCCEALTAAPDTLSAVRRAYERKVPVDRIAAVLGIGHSTLRACKRNGHKPWHQK
jgi:hypothetical protein